MKRCVKESKLDKKKKKGELEEPIVDEGSRRGERELELHVASQWSWLAGEEGQGVIYRKQ